MKLGYIVSVAALSMSCATTTPERITLENVDTALEKAKVATAEAGRIQDLYACQEFTDSYQKIDKLLRQYCLNVTENYAKDTIEQCGILKNSQKDTIIRMNKHCK